MKIHKQGFGTITLTSTVVFIVVALLLVFVKNIFIAIPLILLLLILLGLIFWFFRVPVRIFDNHPKYVYAPADGKIVAIEETFEPEFFKEKRIQVSIFMSPLNVHVNYYPVKGKVLYTKYHPGKYLVAWHPKSSLENERSTVVIEHENGTKVLVRQIAGAVARRIVPFSKTGDQVVQGEELGFIKFGSRVDIFLPTDTKIKVDLNSTSVAMKTILAELP
jgi:phosphatidylserine decarboxylase